MIKVLSIALILAFPIGASANEETRAAVSEVQSQMKSPQFHQEAAKSSPQARQVETQVKQLTGTPENEQELYNLASEVLGNMKDMTPEEMMDFLRQVQSNPEKFANSWTPEQRKKLTELANRLPAAQRKNP